ncbi:hypothetical protein C8J56DRAFT_1043423 [Mycena floridula]|nr:hypothetical protein C8J56DRAFT_1043423 [Mycena floridula]
MAQILSNDAALTTTNQGIVDLLLQIANAQSAWNPTGLTGPAASPAGQAGQAGPAAGVASAGNSDTPAVVAAGAGNSAGQAGPIVAPAGAVSGGQTSTAQPPPDTAQPSTVHVANVAPVVAAAAAPAVVPPAGPALYQASAHILALFPPALQGHVIELNPVFHNTPHPHVLAAHFHGVMDANIYYAVAAGRRVGIFASSSIVEGFTRGVSNNICRRRASFTAALEEYTAAWNAGLVRLL